MDKSVEVLLKLVDVLGIIHPEMTEMIGGNDGTFKAAVVRLSKNPDNHINKIAEWFVSHPDENMNLDANAVSFGLIVGYAQGLRDATVEQILNAHVVPQE